MKALLIFFISLLLIGYSNFITAQKAVYPKPNNKDNIPFGKKLPAPLSFNYRTESGDRIRYDKYLSGALSTRFDATNAGPELPLQQQMKMAFSSPTPMPGNIKTAQSAGAQKNTPSNFHLTKDINTHTQPFSSYPNNTTTYPNRDNFYLSFAVLNNVSYFTANDGIHGGELWRSDGTAEGTFMVKDINSGASGSNLTSIIAANGKLYFSAYTDETGVAPWVSDGTEYDTKLIKNIGGIPPNYQIPMVKVNNTIFFSANSDFGSALWKTDGTQEGTSLVYDFNATDQYAGYITEATAAGGLLFFSAWTPTYGRELWRSDGTTEGTYLVKDIGPGQTDDYSPLQLTAYNNKVYFSGDDGTGRKLWSSDGTTDGTTNVSFNNDVIVQTDFLDYTFNYPFAVLNNVLYLGANSPADGNGLYKYDASNTDGLVLVKDLTLSSDPDFIVPPTMVKVGNKIFFKVINSIGGAHDDLWSSDGTTDNTQIVKTFEPGRATNNYYDGYGTLYFLEDDPAYSGELWKSDGTEAGTVLIKDINPGNAGSWPAFVTPCNGKIQFQATDALHGTELWITDGTDIGTTLVKDINTFNATNTDGSEAGFFFKGLSAIGNAVLVNAFTPELGAELYKSDGSEAGTVLLNDIAPGPDWSFPNAFLFKNKVTYFINDNAIGTSLYKTDGTTAGLQRVTAYINRDNYSVHSFNVAGNGQLFYILYNKYNGDYELWNSKGTPTSGTMLKAGLFYDTYVVLAGNAAFFVAGEFDHGYEVWKSDGTIAGTKLVKDINPGFGGSYPYSLFAYKGKVYFGAYDGYGYFNSFWQTDGTEKGTIKLQNITLAYYSYPHYPISLSSQVFCISNGTLYFTAANYTKEGDGLWMTNGTVKGTKLVKNINPFYTSYLYNLTDVNGTLFFTGDDGVHGNELWKSNGSAKGTVLVKDIFPDGYGYYYNLCSAGGKLYFLNGNTYPNTLWSSDGTANNTNPVADAGLNGLFNISNLTPAGNKLFFGAYTDQYGTELYAGDVSATTLSATVVSAAKVLEEKTNTNFEASLYPNPSRGNSTLTFSGSAKNVSVTIADISGKIIWNKVINGQHSINMPVGKMSAGIYLVIVKNAKESKSLKLVKQ